jgi:hypothetical protein
VDRRASLDEWGKSRLHRDLIPEPSSPWPVAIPITLSGLSRILYTPCVYIIYKSGRVLQNAACQGACDPQVVVPDLM